MIIGNSAIGNGHPCFIIAEAGVNHNGDIKLARKMIDVAAASNVDAIKFQTFKTESIVTADAPKADYQKMTSSQSESQYTMLKNLELSDTEYGELAAYCDEKNVVFLSTPFDEGSADLLEQLQVPAYKISSGDLTNIPLLQHVASKNMPIIMSTGMADLDEVREAVEAVKAAGNDQICLLHCVSNYPAAPEDTNLRAMATMADAFGVLVGYSDHTAGLDISLAAVALGATVIEKHFTLDRTLPGPDHRASMEPDELKALVTGIRKIEQAMGNGIKEPAASEFDTAKVARKSLVAAIDISVGTKLTREMIAIKRPGTGLPPKKIDDVLGRTLKLKIPADHLIELEHLS